MNALPAVALWAQILHGVVPPAVTAVVVVPVVAVVVVAAVRIFVDPIALVVIPAIPVIERTVIPIEATAPIAITMVAVIIAAVPSAMMVATGLTGGDYGGPSYQDTGQFVLLGQQQRGGRCSQADRGIPLARFAGAGSDRSGQNAQADDAGER